LAEKAKKASRKFPVYQRLGLVELGNGAEKLKEEKETVKIKMNNQEQSSLLQTQIIQKEPFGMPSLSKK
jgi:hypothetical protein